MTTKTTKTSVNKKMTTTRNAPKSCNKTCSNKKCNKTSVDKAHTNTFTLLDAYKLNSTKPTVTRKLTVKDVLYQRLCKQGARGLDINFLYKWAKNISPTITINKTIDTLRKMNDVTEVIKSTRFVLTRHRNR